VGAVPDHCGYELLVVDFPRITLAFEQSHHIIVLQAENARNIHFYAVELDFCACLHNVSLRFKQHLDNDPHVH
jgi:hypothetical protein